MDALAADLRQLHFWLHCKGCQQPANNGITALPVSSYLHILITYLSCAVCDYRVTEQPELLCLFQNQIFFSLLRENIYLRYENWSIL